MVERIFFNIKNQLVIAKVPVETPIKSACMVKSGN